ncbi:MAG: N-glycosylase/DNA lyase [archaeon]
MEPLVLRVKELISSEIGKTVESRIAQFKEMQKNDTEEWFSELCFCILTANSSARLGMKIQVEIGKNGFLTLSQQELGSRLKALGHRFCERRAEFIVLARSYIGIKDIVTGHKDEREAREWLAGSVLGIGYKEASHFLRNVGFDNVAILDRHILRTMKEAQLITEVPQALTRRKYLDIEQKLEEVGRRAGLTLSKLDLYLWYMKTGEVLK